MENKKEVNRGFSAKDVSNLRNKIGRKNITAKEVRELLIKNKGSIHRVIVDQKEQIKKTEKNHSESKEHVVHMGKYTYKKRKILYKPNSRRGRKMTKKGIPQYREDYQLICEKKRSDKKKQSKSQKKKLKRSN